VCVCVVQYWGHQRLGLSGNHWWNWWGSRTASWSRSSWKISVLTHSSMMMRYKSGTKVSSRYTASLTSLLLRFVFFFSFIKLVTREKAVSNKWFVSSIAPVVCWDWHFEIDVSVTVTSLLCYFGNSYCQNFVKNLWNNHTWQLLLITLMSKPRCGLVMMMLWHKCGVQAVRDRCGQLCSNECFKIVDFSRAVICYST